MPVLKNPRWERFAQALVARKPLQSEADCYVESGFVWNDGNCSRLKQNPIVASRVEELQIDAATKAARKAGITADRIVEEWGRIALSDIRGVVKWGDGIAVQFEDGRETVVNDIVMLASDTLAPEVAASIKSVKRGRDGTISVEFYDKLAALQNLAKYLGMYRDTNRYDGEGNTTIQVGVQVFSGALAEHDKSI